MSYRIHFCSCCRGIFELCNSGSHACSGSRQNGRDYSRTCLSCHTLACQCKLIISCATILCGRVLNAFGVIKACTRLHLFLASSRERSSPHKHSRKLNERPQAEAWGLSISNRNYLVILVTVPAPTVRPPSRIAKRRPSSIAIGWISSTDISVVSPGITISVPAGRVITPVTSVVRK